MQYSPCELKEKLVRALDHEHNVVDMQRVLEVISILENYPITKENLEKTRLGRYVNEMRRKTNNKDLAKRARNLVRKWQHLVDPRINGERIAESRGSGATAYLPPHLQGSSGSQPSSPASQPATPSSVKSSHSPSLPSRSRPDTPTTARPHTPIGQHSPKMAVLGRPITPGLLDSSKPASPALGGSQTSPGLPTPGRVHISSTPLPGKGAAINHQLSTPSTHETLSKFDAANKKRRRDDDPNGDLPVKKVLVDLESDKSSASVQPLENGLPESHSMGANGSCDRLSPDADTFTSSKQDNSKLNFSAKRNMNIFVRTDLDKSKGVVNKTPKVETTAQLLQKLDLKLPSSDTVSRIANNEIEKECDAEVSVVPAGAKPRPRRKPVLPSASCDSSLEQTKSEMVQKFLQTSVTPSTSELDMADAFKYDLLSRPSSPATSMVDVTGISEHSLMNSSGSAAHDNHSQVAADSHRHDSVARPTMFFIGDEETRQEEGLVTVSEAVQSSQQLDPWSALPPLRMADLVWPSQESEEHPSIEVTESTVDKLHSKHWQGVNGHNDYLDQWKDWTETYSMPTYNGDLLHILPYVNTDD